MEAIKTKVVHSKSKDAWNVVGETPGSKYKIVRVPYCSIDSSEIITTQAKAKALEDALFISYCFNNADKIKFGK